jgi:hypothetical protein
MRALRPWLWASVAAVCVVIFVWSTTRTVAVPLPPFPIDPFWLAWVGLPVVGSFILVKRPGNGVGAVTLGIAVCAAASAATDIVAQAGRLRADVLVLVNQLVFVPVFILLPLLILLFPSGRVPSRAWKLATWAATAVAAVLLVWMALRPVAYSFDNIVFYENPLGIPALADADSVVLTIAQLALTGFGAAALIQAVLAYRRASPLERLQVKWLLVPAVVTPLLFVVGISLEAVSVELANVAVMVALIGGANGMAVGIGVAILRHRLYEIDRIISRTLSYALVIGLLGAIVLALVTGLALFTPSDDPLVVAVATLTVFALFTPIRRRVQLVVDRRFNRSRYDSERVIDRFAGSLQERVDPSGVVDDWVGVVEETMQPVSVGVWVKGGER